MAESRIVIDHIDGICIDTQNPPLKNVQMGPYLVEGICTLYDHVRGEEGRISSSSLKPAFWWSSDNKIIHCAFRWFSVDLCDYVRLVGLIDIMSRQGWKTPDIQHHRSEIQEHCREYLLRCAPDVSRWRGKIGAHAALHSPRSEDNIATLEYSVMPTVQFEQGRYWTGKWQWGTDGVQSEIPVWSLTEEFERLAPRFWPQD